MKPFLILLAILTLWAHGSEEPLTRKVLAVEDCDDNFGITRILFSDGNTLYQLETRTSRLLKITLTEDSISQVELLAEGGDGPGDLFRPSKMAVVPDKYILVNDARGIHVFETDGTFVKLLRIDPPTLSLAANRSNIFRATALPRNPHFFRVLDWDGNQTNQFFEPFVVVEDIGKAVRTHTRDLSYLHSGFLFVDQTHLYYINTTFLKAFKLRHDGTVELERDLSGSFGPEGRLCLEKNEELRLNPVSMGPDLFITYRLFISAYKHDGLIYLLRTSEPYPDMESTLREIFVLRCRDFEVDRVLFRLDRDERAHGITVRDSGRILLNMELNIGINMEGKYDSDVHLVELVLR